VGGFELLCVCPESVLANVRPLVSYGTQTSVVLPLAALPFGIGCQKAHRPRGDDTRNGAERVCDPDDYTCGRRRDVQVRHSKPCAHWQTENAVADDEERCRCPYLQKRGSVSPFPMFVPSLSWQIPKVVGGLSIKWQQNRSF
jgi:hypothetical protein